MSPTANKQEIKIQPGWCLSESGAFVSSGTMAASHSKKMDNALTDKAISRTEREESILDLRQFAIMPGLVNAHTHLNLSFVNEQLPVEQGFVGWIQSLIQSQRAFLTSAGNPTDGTDGSRKDYWREADVWQKGLHECTADGTRLVVDISPRWIAERPDELDNEVRVVPLIEILDPHPHLRTESFDRLDLFQMGSEKIGALGISPHAPYTTSRGLTEQAVKAAAEYERVICMHVAETLDEIEFIERGTGAFCDLIDDTGLLKNDRFQSIDEVITSLAQSNRSLLAHGNYLTAGQIDFVSQHADTMAVVYCPRTHEYFGWQSHPIGELLDRGGTVLLGTDSLASNPDLSVLAEAVWLAANRNDISAEQIIQALTYAGWRFLGNPGHLYVENSSTIVATDWVCFPAESPSSQAFLTNPPVLRPLSDVIDEQLSSMSSYPR